MDHTQDDDSRVNTARALPAEIWAQIAAWHLLDDMDPVPLGHAWKTYRLVSRAAKTGADAAFVEIFIRRGINKLLLAALPLLPDGQRPRPTPRDVALASLGYPRKNGQVGFEFEFHRIEDGSSRSSRNITTTNTTATASVDRYDSRTSRAVFSLVGATKPRGTGLNDWWRKPIEEWNHEVGLRLYGNRWDFDTFHALGAGETRLEEADPWYNVQCCGKLVSMDLVDLRVDVQRREVSFLWIPTFSKGFFDLSSSGDPTRLMRTDLWTMFGG